MSGIGNGAKFIDVEIGLDRKFFIAGKSPEKREYLVEFRSASPDEGADVRRVGQASFDLTELNKLILDPEAYGQAMSRSLFQDTIKDAFAEARASANAQAIPLRLRLLIKPEAAELHSLSWETLRDPVDESYLLTTDENLPFSRYLLSKDWRSVHRRAQHDLNALVIIANPTNLADYKMAPIDVAGELERVKRALNKIKPTVLAQSEAGHAPTIDNLIEELRSVDYDLVYMICHGTQVGGEPILWLEDAEQKVAHLKGTEWIARLRELRILPRLVLLASCQSASDEGASVLAALGPRLVEEGVPAVVAMQGNVSQDSIANFMPEFFDALQKYGEIDRAMAIARGAIRERDDFWMPVLFMRLKDGSIWYEPGFRGRQGERIKFIGWEGLISSIQAGRCIPILGPGLYEWLLGSQREIARRWADAYDYPMSPPERDSMVHVAQYLSVTNGRFFVVNELKKHIKHELLKYYQPDLSPDFLKRNPNLNQVIEAVGSARRKRDANEPYSVLARMPFPIYVTVNPGYLLSEAIKDVDTPAGTKKDPQVVLCPWNDYTEMAYKSSVFKKRRDYEPDPEHPLVFHFFGSLDQDESLVLTEDDYFDFLLGVNNVNSMPSCLNQALVNSSLLFVGFQMEDRNFRTLLRYILSLRGANLLKNYKHVAVQINPEESGFLEPAGAYSYLNSYFYTNEAKIAVYWGSTEDFVMELQDQYKLWAI